MKWQPIETLKNCDIDNPVLFFIPHVFGAGGFVIVGYVCSSGHFVARESGDEYPKPSHWMPLPAPPYGA